MSEGHFVKQCKHGVIVGQCRCPSPNKAVGIVPCPPSCKEEAVTTPEKPMGKDKCVGCYNDAYNHGLGGSSECWSYATAKMEPRILIGMDEPPPYDKKRARPTPTCYQRQRYVNVRPDALTKDGYWK